MAKVVITARLPGRLDELLAGHELITPAGERGILDESELSRVLGDADALLPLLSLRVDEALLARAPRLRVVANYAVGVDNVDVAACTRRGIVVTNTPGVLTEATADLTMALVLATARRLREAMQLVLDGRWHGWEPEQLLGLDLDGAQLGIVGMGRIGRAVARRARGFGMRIVHAHPRPVEDLDGESEPMPFDRLLATSDVISLHVPLRPETRHLIGARELELMRPHAILVNTARGAIVDEQALVSALERGHLGGVGLDVFDEEPRVPERLRAIPRVLCLPHIGSAARGARTRMAETAARSIADVLAGRRPAHPVNPQVFSA
jgi:glyoxylate reductase